MIGVGGGVPGGVEVGGAGAASGAALRSGSGAASRAALRSGAGPALNLGSGAAWGERAAAEGRRRQREWS